MKRKVFGVGLGKTGTSTLGACLKTLGYRVMGCDVRLTRSMRQGNWEPIFEVANRFDAFQDFPWPFAYQELDHRYPGSKYILTIRKTSEIWFSSLCKHAERTGPTEHKRLAYGHEMPYGLKDEHIALYEQHNDAVRAYFSGREDDLLEACFENGDEWEKLCRFLGHTVPSVQFPHLNKAPERHVFTPEQKLAILRAHLLHKVPVAELCARHQISHAEYASWQDQLFQNGAVVFAVAEESDEER